MIRVVLVDDHVVVRSGFAQLLSLEEDLDVAGQYSSASEAWPALLQDPGGVSATIEYAVVALGVTDIVICGHSNCGAMKAIATCQCLEPMPAVSHWPRYADAAKAVVEKKTWASETDKVNGMVQENVIAQLNNIKTHPSVAVGGDCSRCAARGL